MNISLEDPRFDNAIEEEQSLSGRESAVLIGTLNPPSVEPVARNRRGPDSSEASRPNFPYHHPQSEIVRPRPPPSLRLKKTLQSPRSKQTAAVSRILINDTFGHNAAIQAHLKSSRHFLHGAIELASRHAPSPPLARRRHTDESSKHTLDT